MEQAIQGCLSILQSPQQGFERRLEVARALNSTLKLAVTALASPSHQLPANQVLSWQDQRSIERVLLQFGPLLNDRSPQIKAEAAALIALIMTSAPNYYNYSLRWIVSNMKAANTSVERKLLILNASLVFLQLAQPMAVGGSVGMLASLLIESLSSLESPELLTPTLSALLTIFQRYPNSYTINFRDLVDVIIGWRIDKGTSAAAKQVADSIVRELGPLWRRDFEFSLGLLKQFLNDALSIVTHGSLNPVEDINPYYELFALVWKALGFNAANDLPLALNSWMKQEFQVGFSSVVVQYISTSKIVHEAFRLPALVLPMTKILRSLQQIWGANFSQFFLKSAELLSNLVVPSLPTSVLAPFLDLVQPILEAESPRLLGGSVAKFMLPEWLSLRLHGGAGIHAKITAIYRTIFGAPCGQLALQALTLSFTDELSRLKASLSSPSDPDALPRSQIKTLISFDLAALSNLRSPPPTIAKFVLDNFHPFSSELFRRDEGFQLVALSSLLSLAAVTPELDPKAIQTVIDSATEQNRPHLFMTVALEYLGRVSNLNISQSILERVFAMASQGGEDVRLSSIRVLYTILKKTKSSPQNLQISESKIAKLLQGKMEDVSTQVALEASKALALLNPRGMTVSSSPSSQLLQYSSSSVLWIDHFTAYFDNLLDGSSAHFTKLGQILQSFYNSVADKDTFDRLVKNAISSNRKLLDRWAAIEASRFLVASRLRSQFGGANQTFENILRIVTEAAKTSFSIEDLSDNAKWEKISSMRTILEFIDQFDRQLYVAYEGSASSSVYATSNTAILQFFRGNRRVCEDWFSIRLRAPAVIVAQKALSPYHVLRHGYDRLAFLNHIISKKKEKSKVSRPIMIQERGGEDAQAVNEIVELARSLAQAHLWLSDVDGLRALRSWLKKHLLKSSVPLWLDPLIDHADGRFEIALDQYEAIIAARFSSAMKFDEIQALVQDRNFMFVRELQAMAYLAAGLPERALKFQSSSPKGSDWFGPDAQRLSDLSRLQGLAELQSVKPFPSSMAVLSSLPGLALDSLKSKFLLMAGKVDTNILTESREVFSKLLRVSHLEVEDSHSPLLLSSAILANYESISSGNPSMTLPMSDLSTHGLMSETVLARPSMATDSSLVGVVRNLIKHGNRAAAAKYIQKFAINPSISQLSKYLLTYEMNPSSDLASVLVDSAIASPDLSAKMEALESVAASFPDVIRKKSMDYLNTESNSTAALFAVYKFRKSFVDRNHPSTESIKSLILALRGLASLSIQQKMMSVNDLIKFISDSDAASLNEVTAALLELDPALWKDVAAQLISRLDHPSSAARSVILSIVASLAKSHPSSVIYPILSNLKVRKSATLQASFSKLFALVKEQKAELVDEMQILIDDFSMITLLPHEQAAISLRHIQQEVVTIRIPSYLEEVKKIIPNVQAANDSSFPPLASSTPETIVRQLSTRYTTVMSPAFAKIEKLIDQLTSQAPRSPIESKFHAEVLPQLRVALSQFKAPTDFMKPAVSFAPIVNIIDQIAIATKNATLKLEVAAPRLVTLKSGLIPLPRSVLEGGDVFIEAISHDIPILQTKTRPRKVSIKASDGRMYPFLLKGREDLRLDDRIMQFLRSVNVLLEADDDARSTGLRARNYVVIPLAERTALIEWVEGALPAYNVYKSWQKRFHTAQKLLAQPTDPKAEPKADKSDVKSSEIKIQSPVDRFYAKLVPQLKARGIANVSSRKDWPADVVDNVWKELSREVPGHLLSNELWVTSPSASEWWRKQTRFARSNAVMAMTGFVLGLGDRHLDNILIDFESGEIVHIDYNVSFDRGLQLRVPERVPFRLTQLFRHALGPGGTKEGPFMSAALRSMDILRNSRDTLLTILETFVYEPLMDWGVDMGTKAEETRLEVQVLLQLLEARSLEMEKIAQEPTFPLYSAAISKLAFALDLHEKRSQLAAGRDQLVKELASIQAERKQMDAVDRAFASELAEVTNLFAQLSSASTRAVNIYNAEISALSVFQTALPQLSANLSMDATVLATPPNPLNPLAAAVPRVVGAAGLIPNLPLQEALVAQISASEVNFSLALQKQNALAHRLLQSLQHYQSIILQSESPVRFLQNSVSEEWRTQLAQIETEYQKMNGVIPSGESFELLDIISDVSYTLGNLRTSRSEEGQSALKTIYDRSKSLELKCLEIDAEIEELNADIFESTKKADPSPSLLTKPREVLSSLNATLKDLKGSSGLSLASLNATVASLKTVCRLLCSDEVAAYIKFESDSTKEVQLSSASLSFANSIDDALAQISGFSESFNALGVPLMNASIDFSKVLPELQAIPFTASSLSGLFQGLSGSADAGVRSAAFVHSLFAGLSSALPAKSADSFASLEIQFLIDLFERSSSISDRLSKFIDEYLTLLFADSLMPIVENCSSFISSMTSGEVDVQIKSSLDALIQTESAAIGLRSKSASLATQRRHVSEELTLVKKHFEAVSVNLHPEVLAIETSDGFIRTPYLQMLDNLRTTFDALEAERKIAKLVLESYTTLETQVLAIVDWFGQRNRDKNLHLSFMEASKRRKAAVDSMTSHLQQLTDLAMSVLAIEADRSSSVIIAHKVGGDANVDTLQRALGSFWTPQSNLEADSLRLLASFAKILEGLYNKKISVADQKVALKERQQSYDEKRVAVKRLSDLIQSIEAPLDPKGRAAANNPRQIPEYFKVAELVKSPLAQSVENDLLPLLTSIVKLANSSEATATIGQKTSDVINGFKAWLKLIKHLVNISQNADASVTVDSILGDVPLAEAGTMINSLLANLNELAGEQSDLSQTEQDLSARGEYEGDIANSAPLEGDRVDKKMKERSRKAREMLDVVDKKLCGLYQSEKPLSTQEQVDLLINEATATHNLSRMYEGWTSWI